MSDERSMMPEIEVQTTIELVKGRSAGRPEACRRNVAGGIEKVACLLRKKMKMRSQEIFAK
jgi:hypothetical protein